MRPSSKHNWITRFLANRATQLRAYVALLLIDLKVYKDNNLQPVIKGLDCSAINSPNIYSKKVAGRDSGQK